MNNFLEPKDDYKIYDDIQIIVDPDLEDESTADINDYLNKHILQCRICGNLFPSDEILDNDIECPICDSTSSEGFIYKGKLLKKKDDEELSEDEQNAIDEMSNETYDFGEIPIEDDFNEYEKDDLSDNYDDVKQ